MGWWANTSCDGDMGTEARLQERPWLEPQQKLPPNLSSRPDWDRTGPDRYGVTGTAEA